MTSPRHLRLVRPRSRAASGREFRDRSELWLALSAVAIGLVPFVGLTVVGHWSERELGTATLLLLVGLRGLAGGLFWPRR